MHENGSGTTEDPRAALQEMARIALADHSMQSLLDRVAALGATAVPGTVEASVTVIGPKKAMTVVSTGALATQLDQAQYDRGDGPCLHAARSGEVTEVTDARSSDRWTEYCGIAAQQGSLSSLSVPLPVPQQVQLALNLYAREAHAYDEDSRELARAFAAHAAAAVANMHVYESSKQLAEQLQQAMESRAVIEQAKGVLMAQSRCSADEAFARLVDISQRTNRRLREVAQALVDTIATP